MSVTVFAMSTVVNLAVTAISIAVLFGRRPADRRQNMVKEMQRMLSQLRKGKPLTAPPTASRTEIVTSVYSSNMTRAGLEVPADMAEGTTPSYTRLAQYLRNAGLDEGLVEAMQTGVLEADSEAHVAEIIDAAAGTPEVKFTGEELERVKDLAKEEWKRGRRASGE